jgi:hypothetical protein
MPFHKCLINFIPTQPFILCFFLFLPTSLFIAYVAAASFIWNVHVCILNVNRGGTIIFFVTSNQLLFRSLCDGSINMKIYFLLILLEFMCAQFILFRRVGMKNSKTFFPLFISIFYVINLLFMSLFR